MSIKQVSLLSIATMLGCAVFSPISAMAQVQLKGKIGLGINQQDDLSELSSVAVKRHDREITFTDAELSLNAEHDFSGGYKLSFETVAGYRNPDSDITAKEVSFALMTPVGRLAVGKFNTGYFQPKAFAQTQISLPGDYRGEDLDYVAATTRLGPVLATYTYMQGGTQDLNSLAQALSDLLSGGYAGNHVPGGPGGGKGPIQIKTLVLDYKLDQSLVRFRHNHFSTYTSNLQDPAAVALVRSTYEGRGDNVLILTHDFNVAQVGFGYEWRGLGWANQLQAGVNVPVGAWSFGATYEHKGDDTNTIGQGVVASQFAAQGSKLAMSILGLRDLYGNPVLDLTGGDVKGTAERSLIRLGAQYQWDANTAINLSVGRYNYGAAKRNVPTLLGLQPQHMTHHESQLRLVRSF